MTRRGFVKAGGLSLVVIGVEHCLGFLGRTALAAILPSSGAKRKTLVVIFQRGAMDGLMAVTPFTDPVLKEMRPRLGMTVTKSEKGESLIDLDGRFGLHPALSAFEPLYKSGQLAIVHGIGSPNPTRSHFDAQDYMEIGTPGRKDTQSGWLNRASGLLGHERTSFCACSMTSALPRSLYGTEPANAIARLSDFALRKTAKNDVAKSVSQSFESLYAETSQKLLHDTGQESFEAMKTLSQLHPENYVPANGAVYPNSALGNSLKQVAELIKADVGLEIAAVESNGWDTHFAQGTSHGVFAQSAMDLSGSISAFWHDLDARSDDVTIMTMTEFGRTVHENGSGGTDHGRGSCMFALGNDVVGGKVYGTVGSLAKEALEDGRDLPVTTDFRAFFSAVAGTHLQISEDEKMFPGWKGGRLQIMRA